MYAVEAEGLKKSFGETEALRGVDLAVAPATVLGLLGPNGAGKTTAVRILTTLLKADAGRAVVDGVDVAADPRAVRARIGLTGQYAAVDERLTGFESLEHVGRLFHLRTKDAKARATELLERFDLSDAGDRVVKGYSGGMRRRLDIAMSLVSRPSVLFLDEPTTGLDPRSRLGMWDLIEELVAEGTTTLLTTQYLDEAERLADHIVVIDHGTVIAKGHRRRAQGPDRWRPPGGHRRPRGRPRPDRRAAAGPVRGQRRRTGRPRGPHRHHRRQRHPQAGSRGGPPPRRRRDRGRRRRGPPAHARRRVPATHRPHHRDRDRRRGGRAMTATTSTAPTTPGPTPRGPSWARVDVARHVDRGHAPPACRAPEPRSAHLRHHPADHVRAAVQLRVRRLDRRTGLRQLHPVPDPGRVRPDGALRLRLHRHRRGRGHDEGHHRPPSIAADVPAIGARRVAPSPTCAATSSPSS